MNNSNPHVTAERWHDQQYAAAFYIFSQLRWRDKRAACFAHVVEHGIEKAKLLKVIRAWSHGEQVLVKIALDLFDPGCVKENRGRPVDFGEAANILDAENLETVFNAVRIARGELQVEFPAIAEAVL